MGLITLSEGFTVIPEGTHIFKIIGVTYKEEFGKLEIKMRTAGGLTHVERYQLKKKNGDSNEGALNAFSYFAKTALGDFSATRIDPEELVGCFIECDVEHDIQESTKDPDKTVTFVRLTDKRQADGYDEPEVPMKPPAKSKPAAKKATVPDLDALLG